MSEHILEIKAGYEGNEVGEHLYTKRVGKIWKARVCDEAAEQVLWQGKSLRKRIQGCGLRKSVQNSDSRRSSFKSFKSPQCASVNGIGEVEWRYISV